MMNCKRGELPNSSSWLLDITYQLVENPLETMDDITHTRMKHCIEFIALRLLDEPSIMN